MFILITVTSSTIMFLAKISREFKKQNMHFTKINDVSRPSRDRSLFQIPASISESLLRVIVLSSLVYPNKTIIIITYLTRVNPSAEAVINGCPGQLNIISLLRT